MLGFPGAVSLSGQPPESDEAKEKLAIFQRFSAVKKWSGTFTLTFEHRGTDGEKDPTTGSSRWFGKGTFTLDSSKHQPGKVAWQGEGRGVGHLRTEQTFTTHWGNTNQVGMVLRHSVSASGGGVLSAEQTFPERVRNVHGTNYGPTLEIWHLTKASSPWYQLRFGALPLDFRDAVSKEGFDIRGSLTERWARNESGNVWFVAAVADRKLDALKLPATGLRLKGQADIPVYQLDAPNTFGVVRDPMHVMTIYHAYPKNQRPTGRIEWDLWPSRDDLELVVEPNDYDTWVPEAGKDETTPGNQITIRASLKKKGPGATDVKAKKISFELVDVSREPGICINWPPKDRCLRDPADASKFCPDLRFHQNQHQKQHRAGDDDGTQASVIEPNGLKAGTPPGVEMTKAWATIRAHDWGAFGVLKVTAELTSGEPLTGYLKGSPGQELILLPKRQSNSCTADKWKADHGVADQADIDDKDHSPVGDDGREGGGDGLTLYEEYRGFYKHGVHQRGDPKTKDFFVLDKTGSRYTMQGIVLFQRLTGLEIHRLAEGEMDSDRVVDFNFLTAHRDDCPGVAGQHGILIEMAAARPVDPAKKSDNQQEYLNFGESARAEGGPGTPKMITHVLINPSELPSGGSAADRHDFAATVAHELCHCANVWHHGDRDIQGVQWRRSDDGSAIEERSLDKNGDPWGPARKVSVWLPGGHAEIPAVHSTFDSPKKWWIARPRGQHSGPVHCVMRYYIAHAIEVKVDSVTEEQKQKGGSAEMRQLVNVYNQRNELCSSATGVYPYGDADDEALDGPRVRGYCKGLIRVNDYDNRPLRGR
jgi:hypothetical protein